MKKLTILLYIFCCTNCYSQLNIYSGLSIANFYENKNQSEAEKKVVLHAGIGYDLTLYKSSISLTSKIYYTQLGGMLVDMNEFKTNYTANCIAASIGLKFRNNFKSKNYFNISISPTFLYVNSLQAEIEFLNSERKPLKLSLDEKNPKTQQWNSGVNFETGIDFKVYKSRIGINFFHTFYFDDMGGTRRYAYGGGYENNKYYFENSGLRLIYIFE